jgi:hypothetical protein
MNSKLKSSLLTLSIAAALTACGGGGGGAAPGTTATPVTSSGAITQFGSVYVNGVRYATTSARIVSEDDGTTLLENPSDDQLRNLVGLGNVITVIGTRSDDSNGTATTIFVDNELVGEVASVSDADASFVVLGQTISVTPDTIIDDSIIETLRQVEIPADLRFADLNPGETLSALLSIGLLVEISGFPTANGLEATRIEDVIASGGTIGGGNNVNGSIFTGEAEIKGFVSGLGASSFQINGLTVNFDASDLDSEDFASRSLADGDFVEVHGSVSGSTLDATRIELEDRIPGSASGSSSSSSSGEFEIEGVISSVTPDGSGGGTVTINGITISVSDISQFQAGLRVEIKGSVLADGSISLTRLKDEEEDTVRTIDTVVSADGDSFITRLGLDIAPTSRSRLEDDTDTLGDNPSVSAFLSAVSGERVEARGFPLNGAIAWTRVEMDDDNDTDCRLRGPVASIGSNDFTIDAGNIDVTINVDSVSESSFEDANDLPIGRQAFFNQLSVGAIVQATSNGAGGCVTGQLTAREVEFEPENGVLFSDDSSSSSSSSSSNGSASGFGNQIVASVTNITTTSFVIAGETISVNASTLIDDSIVEDFRQVELNSGDLALGSLQANETLPNLLNDGGIYEVIIDRSGATPVAVSIED